MVWRQNAPQRAFPLVAVRLVSHGSVLIYGIRWQRHLGTLWRRLLLFWNQNAGGATR